MSKYTTQKLLLLYWNELSKKNKKNYITDRNTTILLSTFCFFPYIYIKDHTAIKKKKKKSEKTTVCIMFFTAQKSYEYDYTDNTSYRS